MPSSKVLERKKTQVKSLSDCLNKALVGVIVGYKGISVSQDTALRRELRSCNVNYRVFKNNIIRRSLEMSGIVGADGFLTGDNAVATSESSYSDAPRILCNFSKDHEFYKIKVGFIDDKVVDASEIKALSELPSREVLISKVVYVFMSPVTCFVNALHNIKRSLVVVLYEIAKIKES